MDEYTKSSKYNQIITDFKLKIRTLERRIYLWHYMAYLAFITGMLLGVMSHEIGVRMWSL